MARASQSALHPAAGSGAELIDQLGTILYIGASAIFRVRDDACDLRSRRQSDARQHSRWVIGGGFVFPVVVLTALLVYSLAVGQCAHLRSVHRMRCNCFSSASACDARLPPRVATDNVLRIHVVGKQWWWEVRYEQPGERDHIVLANEVRMPVDRPVELVLSTTDVIHSLWVPSLAGKVDMIPGRTTRLRMQTSELGKFRASMRGILRRSACADGVRSS